jgi:hypothetical protein
MLRLLTPVLAALAAVLLGTRRRVVGHLEQAGAFSAETATSPPRARFFLVAWWRTRLAHYGVVRRESGGREWLDRAAWHEYRRVRRRRALVIVLPLLAILAGLMAFGPFGP